MAAEQTIPTFQNQISRTSLFDEKFSLRIGCFNIANAKIDGEYKPLSNRKQKIIDSINRAGLDVLCLLEANRPSKDMIFAELAAEIEKQTGLKFVALHNVNASANAFGKALFVNPVRAQIVQSSQH